MQMPWFKFLYLGCVTVLAAALCSGCAKENPEMSAASGLTAWVTVQPQQYLVQRVGDVRVSVEVLVRPGQSPEMYAPGAAQIAKLARADVYFGIGMPIEGTLFKRMRSSMSGVEIVQTGGEPSTIQDHHDHAGHDHDHHGENDPHIWMDPVRMIGVVEQVRDALIELDPEAAAEFSNNADVLIAELIALDVRIRVQLAPFAGRAFFINHPALGHFAERYDLVQLSIEESGSTPSAGRVAELIGLAREAQVGAIFTQPEFGRTTATVLGDALNLEVIELNVLLTDYFIGMTTIADSLEESFAR